MVVEYLLAREDGTWNTDCFDVPLEEYDRESLVDWAEQHIMTDNRFRDVVCVQVYHVACEYN